MNRRRLIDIIRIVCVVGIFAILPLELLAVPAAKRWYSKQQPDGSTVTLTLIGDEHFHYFATTDSIPVFENEKNGSYCYAYLDGGELKVSDIEAHDQGARGVAEQSFIQSASDILSHIRAKRKVLTQTANSRRLSRHLAKRNVGQAGDYTGLKRGLVVLVEFDNLSFSSEAPNQEYNAMFNQPGYCENGAIGSVSDYFYDQSYGQFILKFDVVGPVKVSRNYGYYGGNSMGGENDKRAREMIVEACNLLDGTIDLSPYDWDGDGEADQVFFIYAGYGEATGGASNTIWPHEWVLGDLKVNIGGIYVNTYACSNELYGGSGTVKSGMGTACHEFSHCLGYPDLYDTDYSGAFGMADWDVMNSGSYAGPNGIGEVPYGFSAYERWFAGWIEPTVLFESQDNLQLRDLGKYPDAYVIYNAGNIDEYFMLENHQADRWYTYVNTCTGIHGMMATHIDYDPIAWANNVVNPKPDKQRFTIIPADGKYGYSEEDYRGDLFPGFAEIVTLSKYTHQDAGARLYNENSDGTDAMHMAVTSIREEDGVVSFDVLNTWDIAAPQILETTDVTPEGYTAHWEEIPDAERYEVEQSSVYLINGQIPIKRKETVKIAGGTSAHMKWLIEGCDAKYCVRAIIKGVPTEWSDYQNVVYYSVVEKIVDDGVLPCTYYGADGVRRTASAKGFNIIIDSRGARKAIIK